MKDDLKPSRWHPNPEQTLLLDSLPATCTIPALLSKAMPTGDALGLSSCLQDPRAPC